jgi:hypothetical protein
MEKDFSMSFEVDREVGWDCRAWAEVVSNSFSKVAATDCPERFF